MATPELLRLRRRVEALEENLDLEAEQVAPGVWTLPSRSRSGDFHIVTRLCDETLLCTCEGAGAGQPCRHREAVAVLLEREQWEQQERACTERKRQSWYSAPRPLKRVVLT
jgi:hypothetical protein